MRLSLLALHMFLFIWGLENSSCLHAADASKVIADSIENAVAHLKSDSVGMIELANAANTMNYIDPIKGIQYALKSLTIAEEIGSNDGKAYAKTVLGLCYIATGDVSNAMQQLKEAESIYSDENNLKGMANTHNLLGNAYFEMGDISNASYYYLKVLKFAEDNDNKRGMASAYTNLGNVNDAIKEYQAAYEYYSKALLIAREISVNKVLAINTGNLGIVELKLKKYDEAIAHSKEAFALNKEAGNLGSMAFNAVNLGDIYTELKDYRSGISYYEKALDLAVASSNTVALIDAKGSLGKSYYEISLLKENASRKRILLDSALFYLNSAVSISEAKSIPVKSDLFYKTLSMIYLESGDKDKVLFYLNKAFEVKDSLYSSDKLKQIGDLKKIHEVESKDKEISLLNADKDKRLMVIAFCVTAVILLGIIVYILIARFRKQREMNVLLKDRNELIETANYELNEQNILISESARELELLNDNLKQSEARLAEAVAAKDKFFSIISHDLRTPFTGFIGLTELLSKEIDNLETEDIKSMALAMFNASHSTYGLLTELLEWSRFQTGSIPFNPSNVLAENIINSCINPLRNAAEGKNIRIVTEAESGLESYCDINMITTVIRNLVSNAIKFTPEKGEIFVGAYEENNRVRFDIRDTGIGIPDEYLRMLFRIDSHLTTKGTNNEQGTGLGLILCKEFVEKHGGTISVKSTVGEGSTFSFTLPKVFNPPD